MKILLSLTMLFALSNAGRIPRSFDDDARRSFPNLRTVYHGHGATSYQNVQLQHHAAIPIATESHNSEHIYDSREVSSIVEVPILDDELVANHYVDSTIEPYVEVEFEGVAATSPSFYEHYDHTYNLGYD